MTESNEAPKKVSLQEAVKRQLEAKKNQASDKQSGGNGSLSTKKMKSQQTKKVSNNRRKMGT
ncbi:MULTISPECIES: hypothetical protein [Planococcus]|uniref:Uncharacterized protein n=1 Tax=Planococcus antarcticus DSM 14505 TaxID=1185653 RepID=A0A1C7DJ14_9BACL|nr:MULTISPECIES: hypothetical protein [Planococcus]ANU11414.1 hypothetical protein BBH88_14470 [Planococcus antarcticus DSM 14505]EIM06638.1 hypothetical protein A1A1_10136 [Planococcus antarcticus DSM 14505]